MGFREGKVTLRSRVPTLSSLDGVKVYIVGVFPSHTPAWVGVGVGGGAPAVSLGRGPVGERGQTVEEEEEEEQEESMAKWGGWVGGVNRDWDTCFCCCNCCTTPS